MLKPVCDCGGVTIKLMPDYSSDGIWCDKCGCGLSGEEIGLPDWLTQNIRDWNNYWDRSS